MHTINDYFDLVDISGLFPCAKVLDCYFNLERSQIMNYGRKGYHHLDGHGTDVMSTSQTYLDRIVMLYTFALKSSLILK